MSDDDGNGKNGKNNNESRRACAPFPRRPLRHITILVTGLSAREDRKYDTLVREYNRRAENIRLGLGMTKCDNEKEGSIISNVFRSVCHLDHQMETSYIRRVSFTVLRALNARLHVTLVGYSYGGSVVHRALAYLRLIMSTSTSTSNVLRSYAVDNGHGEGKKMRIYAFGSIYVPTVKDPVFPVQHFMFADDWLALACNHAKAPQDRPRGQVVVDAARNGGRGHGHGHGINNSNSRREPLNRRAVVTKRDGVRWLRPHAHTLALNPIDRGVVLHRSYPIDMAFPMNDPAFAFACASAAGAIDDQKK